MKRNLFFLMIVSMLLISMNYCVLAQDKSLPIMFKQVAECPPARSTWIGVLQGTWKEMGIQYGERAAKDIRTNFEIAWEDAINGKGKDWQKIRTVEERKKYIAAYIEQSFKEVAALSPEYTELIQGVAEGAASELNKSKYANDCSNFIKIGFISFGSIHYTPNLPGVEMSDGCNGFYVKGEATTGETYGTGTSQDLLVGGIEARQIACIFMPKDPNARVLFYNRAAGEIAAGGNGVMNDLGVAVVMQGAQYSDANEQWEETLAPGIKDFVLGFYAVAFSKTAHDAAEIATVGTPKYRELTGRKTVLRARGANMLFMDANEAYCVEQNAKHYTIRRPGDLGEKGNNFIVSANHFEYKDGSYDENNTWNSNEPMTKYCPPKEGESSYNRFWSGWWEVYNNYGKIDREMMLRKLVTTHNAYDKNGNKIAPDPITGAPTVNTFCSHDGPRSEMYPLGEEGDAATSVYVLSSAEAYWVPAFPCSYEEKIWNYVDLKPYAEYRKLLWNIK